MKERHWEYLIGVCALAIGFGTTYLLALAGEPRSVWLLRDILGILG